MASRISTGSKQKALKAALVGGVSPRSQTEQAEAVETVSEALVVNSQPVKAGEWVRQVV